jgi:hypothetical protein
MRNRNTDSTSHKLKTVWVGWAGRISIAWVPRCDERKREQTCQVGIKQFLVRLTLHHLCETHHAQSSAQLPMASLQQVSFMRVHNDVRNRVLVEGRLRFPRQHDSGAPGCAVPFLSSVPSIRRASSSYQSILTGQVSATEVRVLQTELKYTFPSLQGSLGSRSEYQWGLRAIVPRL